MAFRGYAALAHSGHNVAPLIHPQKESFPSGNEPTISHSTMRQVDGFLRTCLPLPSYYCRLNEENEVFLQICVMTRCLKYLHC